MHPCCKMSKALTQKERKEWNDRVYNIVYGDLDQLEGRLATQPELHKLAASARQLALSLPIFDEDGGGATWGGKNEIFSGHKIN